MKRSTEGRLNSLKIPRVSLLETLLGYPNLNAMETKFPSLPSGKGGTSLFLRVGIKVISSYTLKYFVF